MPQYQGQENEGGTWYQGLSVWAPTRCKSSLHHSCHSCVIKQQSKCCSCLLRWSACSRGMHWDSWGQIRGEPFPPARRRFQQGPSKDKEEAALEAGHPPPAAQQVQGWCHIWVYPASASGWEGEAENDAWPPFSTRLLRNEEKKKIWELWAPLLQSCWQKSPSQAHPLLHRKIGRDFPAHLDLATVSSEPSATSSTHKPHLPWGVDSLVLQWQNHYPKGCCCHGNPSHWKQR